MFKSGNGWGNGEDGPGRPFVVASPRVTKKNDTQGKAAKADGEAAADHAGDHQFAWH